MGLRRVTESLLPDSYGRTRLVVLVVDPYAVHAYWEIHPATLAEAAQRLKDGVDKSQAVLRFSEMSPDAAELSEGGAFDIKIRIEARHWYVSLWSPGKLYLVDLGLKTRDGDFFSLARDSVQTPRAWPEPKVNESFTRVSGEERRAEVVPRGEDRKPAQTTAEVIESEAPPISVSRNLEITTLQVVREKYETVSERPPQRDATGKPPVTVETGDRDQTDLAAACEQSFVTGSSSIAVHQNDR